MNTYETTSLQIASYLQSKKVIAIEVKKDGGKALFVFNDDGTIDDLISKYYLGEKVSAIDHWNEIKTLKSRVYG